MHSREIAGPRILRKSTIIWIFLQRLSIHPATAWLIPDLLKALAILSETTNRRSAVETIPETILEIRKEGKFIGAINKAINYKFLKDITNNRKKTNSVVVFSCRSLPKIPEYKDHR